MAKVIVILNIFFLFNIAQSQYNHNLKKAAMKSDLIQEKENKHNNNLKYDLFVAESEFNKYNCYKEFSVWKIEDMPQKIVQVNSFARLKVLKGAFLFRAYDENDKIIYEEVFNLDNQQTLLKPNIRHSATPIEEKIECQLQFYK